MAPYMQEGTSADEGALFAAVVDARELIEVAVMHGWERVSVARLRAVATELGHRELPSAGQIAQTLEDLAERAEQGEHPRPEEQVRLDLAALLPLVRPAWWPAVDDPDPAF
jgi:hypothetical protein